MRAWFLLFFRNFTGPWLAALLVTLFILVIRAMGVWLEVLAGSGSPSVILAVAGWTALMLLPGALSVASMAAAVLTAGNLVEHRAVQALYSAGVSVWKASVPALVAGALAGGVAVVASQHLAPAAYRNLTRAVYEAKFLAGGIHLQSGRFIQDLPGLTLYMANDDPTGRGYRELLIYDRRDPGASLPVVMLADRGKVFLERSTLHMTLYRGATHRPDSSGSYLRTTFDSLSLRIPVSQNDQPGRAPAWHRYFASNHDLLQRRDSLKKRLLEFGTLGDSPLQAEVLEREAKVHARLAYEWQRRWSMPFNALLFLIIGWGMGLLMGRGGFARAALVSLAFTIWGALLMEQGKRLAYTLQVSPEWGAWLPVTGTALVALAVVMFIRRRRGGKAL